MGVGSDYRFVKGRASFQYGNEARPLYGSVTKSDPCGRKLSKPASTAVNSCIIRGMRTPLLVSVVCLAMLTPLAATRQPASPQRILFIGNSLSYSNDGLWTHLTQLTAGTAIRLETGRAAFPGEFLKSLWERPEPRQAIRTGRWNVVVLQEDLPETRIARRDARSTSTSLRLARRGNGRPNCVPPSPSMRMTASIRRWPVRT